MQNKYSCIRTCFVSQLAFLQLTAKLELLIRIGRSRHTERLGSGTVIEAVHKDFRDAATIRVDLVKLIKELVQQDGVHDDGLRIRAGICRLQLVGIVEIIDGTVIACHAEAADATITFA